jgi:cytochrome c biogenesis protein CcmG, thiol:disulfide interchange protein DsbE
VTTRRSLPSPAAVALAVALAIAAATMLVACGSRDRGGPEADTGNAAAPDATELPAPATGDASNAAAPARAAVSAGDAAPDVAARRATDDTPVRLADLRGEVVLLNLWATWCKPCRAEIPALEQLHQEFRTRGLAVVGASLDADVGREQVADFAQRLGATYAIWMDADDAMAGAFQPLGLPTTFVIDRGGVIRWRHTGPVKADDPSLREVLGEVLAR